MKTTGKETPHYVQTDPARSKMQAQSNTERLSDAQKLVRQTQEDYKQQCAAGSYLVDRPFTLQEAISFLQDED